MPEIWYIGLDNPDTYFFYGPFDLLDDLKKFERELVRKHDRVTREERGDKPEKRMVKA